MSADVVLVRECAARAREVVGDWLEGMERSGWDLNHLVLA